MTGRHRRAIHVGPTRLVGTSIVVLALVTGCSTVVQGSATRDSGFTPGDALPELLNAGNYPTKPSRPMGTGGADGAVLEGQRMAEYVVGPWEVDATLLKPALDGTMVWKSPQALAVTMAAPEPDIAGRHQFLVGFGSSRSSSEPPGQLKGLTNGVLRFASPDDAAAAAAEMGAPSPPAEAVVEQTPFPIPGHPEAVAVSASLDDGTATVESFTPNGTYVFYGYARSQNGNRDDAAAMVAKLIDLQANRIEEFTPTDPAKFADLPVDPTGLLARTLPVPKGQVTIRNGSWGPYAALHYAVDPVGAAKSFAAGALVQKTFGKAMVFESPDADASSRLFDAFLADPAPEEKPVDGVPGLPSARCNSTGGGLPGQPLFTCTLRVDRYVAQVASSQIPDVHQQAAAQYLILTAK